MTVHLSPHKVSKILRGYFHGLPQTKIAKEVNVDQSSISHYANRFKKMVAEYGVLAAGREYKVLSEVESLRSLSVELFNSKLTVEEAKQGHNIINAFLKLGVKPEQHRTLIEICQEVTNPDFVEAALKLSQIKDQTGMNYYQVISSVEKAKKQLPQLEGKVANTKAELESVMAVLSENKQKSVSQKEYLEKYQNDVKSEVARLEKKFSAKMKQLVLKEKEVKEIAELKNKLAKRGLTISTLLQIAEEFKQ